MVTVSLTLSQAAALMAAATNDRDWLLEIHEYDRKNYPGKELTEGIRALESAMRVAA